MNTAIHTSAAGEVAEEVAKTTQDTVQQVNNLTTYIQNNIPNLISFGLKVIFAIVLFCIGRIVIGWIRKIVRRSLERSSMDKGVEQFVDSMLKFSLYFLLIFTIATKFGVDTASVAAIIASAGVAVGLALQGSLSNFAGGVLLLILKPFKVGDYIIEETYKNEGTVTEIQIFYTKLHTIDNKIVVIPNGILTNNSLINATETKERQLDLEVRISYDADLKKAKTLIGKILDEDEKVFQDQEKKVFVSELEEYSVVLGLRAWVSNDDYWESKWRVLEQIKLSFSENGIEMSRQGFERILKAR